MGGGSPLKTWNAADASGREAFSASFGALGSKDLQWLSLMTRLRDEVEGVRGWCEICARALPLGFCSSAGHGMTRLLTNP